MPIEGGGQCARTKYNFTFEKVRIMTRYLESFDKQGYQVVYVDGSSQRTKSKQSLRMAGLGVFRHARSSDFRVIRCGP